jgi:ubiquinone/menaquinone biosynthesis C-methylase UbiE
MAHDLYEDIAGRYGLACGPIDPEDSAWTPFFRQLFTENHVQSVLDCACGTGRHLFLFHALGLEATGADASAAMLAQAGKNLALRDAEIPQHLVDYRRLVFDPYDKGASKQLIAVARK